MEVLKPSRHENPTPMPSCPIASAVPGLSRPLLTEMFATIEDPRDPRGIRHPLATILTIAQAAVIAGAEDSARDR